MEVYLTRHARNRMRLYEIGEEAVGEALRKPDDIIMGEFGRRHAWKRGVGNVWLRVTFVDEGARRVVITVTPKRHGPGGDDAH